jgi:hypothetical protein
MERERNPGIPKTSPDSTAFHPGYKVLVKMADGGKCVARMERERNPGMPEHPRISLRFIRATRHLVARPMVASAYRAYPHNGLSRLAAYLSQPLNRCFMYFNSDL